MRIRLLFATMLLLVAVTWTSSARAQGTEERIDRYDVDIKIQDDGALLITEVIAYDFGTTQHHGIFRLIPVRLRYDDTYDRIYRLEVLSVTASPGTPSQYEVEGSGGDQEIKIGDPDRTITGQHTYTITYRIEGALNGFPDHDELYWNAVGADWSVSIHDVSVRVIAPVAISDVACYSGELGSRLGCPSASIESGVARFLEAQLGPYTALTVVVGFRTGFVPPPAPILVERWAFSRAFTVSPGTIVGTGGLLLLVVLGFAWLAWAVGRDRRAPGSVVEAAFAGSGLPGTMGPERPVGLFEGGESAVEYAPPDGLRPGQIGTLVDEMASPLDVTATVVDLAVRGFLRIEEIPKKSWFGKPDWRLVKLKDGDGLLGYEQILLAGLFEDAKAGESGPTVLLSKLKKKFVSRLQKVQEALYMDAVDQGWFVGRPDKVRSRWHGIGVGLVVVSAIILYALARWTHLGLLGLPLLLGAFLVLIAAHWMPRRTAKGTGLVRRVAGFRRYIATAEKEPAQFAERANLFYQYLPFAVVFGCTDKWANAFAALGQLPDASSWYVGTGTFTVMQFSDAIDGFAVTSTGTIASTPGGSGSSGFGGGGFSGGGGGGGGGGSW